MERAGSPPPRHRPGLTPVSLPRNPQNMEKVAAPSVTLIVGCGVSSLTLLMLIIIYVSVWRWGRVLGPRAGRGGGSGLVPSPLRAATGLGWPRAPAQSAAPSAHLPLPTAVADGLRRRPPLPSVPCLSDSPQPLPECRSLDAER